MRLCRCNKKNNTRPTFNFSRCNFTFRCIFNLSYSLCRSVNGSWKQSGRHGWRSCWCGGRSRRLVLNSRGRKRRKLEKMQRGKEPGMYSRLKSLFSMDVHIQMTAPFLIWFQLSLWWMGDLHLHSSRFTFHFSVSRLKRPRGASGRSKCCSTGGHGGAAKENSDEGKFIPCHLASPSATTQEFPVSHMTPGFWFLP